MWVSGECVGRLIDETKTKTRQGDAPLLPVEVEAALDDLAPVPVGLLRQPLWVGGVGGGVWGCWWVWCVSDRSTSCTPTPKREQPHARTLSFSSFMLSTALTWLANSASVILASSSRKRSIQSCGGGVGSGWGGWWRLVRGWVKAYEQNDEESAHLDVAVHLWRRGRRGLDYHREALGACVWSCVDFDDWSWSKNAQEGGGLWGHMYVHIKETLTVIRSPETKAYIPQLKLRTQPLV